MNTGDEHQHYRSRLEAKKLRRSTVGDLFAAIPPLTVINMLMAIAVTEVLTDHSGTSIANHTTSRLELRGRHACTLL